MQVIKQCWGQDKLPAGLHTRCKSKRKREQQEPEAAGVFPRGEVAGSSLPPPGLGIVLPGDRKSLLCRGLDTSHATPAAKMPFAPALHWRPSTELGTGGLSPATSYGPFSQHQQLHPNCGGHPPSASGAQIFWSDRIGWTRAGVSVFTQLHKR